MQWKLIDTKTERKTFSTMRYAQISIFSFWLIPRFASQINIWNRDQAVYNKFFEWCKNRLIFLTNQNKRYVISLMKIKWFVSLLDVVNHFIVWQLNRTNFAVRGSSSLNFQWRMAAWWTQANVSNLEFSFKKSKWINACNHFAVLL